MVKGIFIVLDGIDGSGKSEMVQSLGMYLSKNENYDVLTTREPTDGKYGKEIRAILANEKDPKINGSRLLELFIKDREDHLKNDIVPFLNRVYRERNIVVCDRYYYSTIAFQALQGLNPKMLVELNKDFLKPDMAFIFDLDPKIALQRISARKKEKFEQLEFMKRLRQKFLEIPNILNDNIRIIDASKSKEDLFEDVKREIEKVL
jgi:dTMP kinase